MLSFSSGLVLKNLPANAGDINSIPELGRNPMDRGAWQATVHGVTKKLDMT